MKKILALLIAFMLIIPANTVFVFASDLPDNIIYSEDFEDYGKRGELPSGWSWVTVPEASDIEVNPDSFDKGHGTAMRIRSEGTEVSYMKTPVSAVDLTKGVSKLSFQLYLDGVGQTAGASQQIHMYLGTTTPLVKGLRVANGVVYYASSSSERWTHKASSSSVYPNTWYTFDVVNDFDNNKTYYFMDGKPLCDAATGEVVVTECYNLGSSATVSDLYVLARSKHTDAEAGGDIVIDNITVSSGAGGVYTDNGIEISTLPDVMDIKFTTGLAPENFSREEITITKHTADDVLMQNGEKIPFAITYLNNSSCGLALTESVSLEDYEKIKVDFGSNKDCMGKKLSYTYYIKVPAEEETEDLEVMYDSETEGAYDVELVSHRTDITDYDFAENGADKKGLLFSTQTGSSPAPTVRISRSDNGNLIENGYEYHLTYRMKILDGTKNVTGSEYHYRLAGEFDAKKDASGTKLYNAGAVQLLYSTNNGLNGFYREDEAKIVKLGFTYKFNSDTALTGDINSLFAAQKWLTYDVNIYPDTKSWSFTVESESGIKETHQYIPVSYWDTTFASRYSAKYPSTDMSVIDGELKNLRFFFSSAATNVVIDNLKLERKEAGKETATVKSVAVKDEDGTLMSITEGITEPGAKQIEIAFDGTVDTDLADGIFVSGSRVPSYSGEFDPVRKIYTITFDDIVGGNGDYTVNFPDELNLNYGISSLQFSTSEGEIVINQPVININGTTAYAEVYTKNTTYDTNAPATMVIAAYKNGLVTDMLSSGIVVSPCSSGNLPLGEISVSDADMVKAFVLDNGSLCHIADYTQKTISVSQADTNKEYKISGTTDSSYVTAVLMNPSAADKTTAYTLENLSEEDAFSYIDVVPSENGEYSFGFDINGKSGKYTLYVVSEVGDILAKKEIYYSDDTERGVAQELVKEAATKDTFAEMYTVLTENSIELGIAGNDIFEGVDMEYLAAELYKTFKANGIDTSDRNAVRKTAGNIILTYGLTNGDVADISVYEEVAGVFDTEPVKTWYGKGIADSKKITARLSGKRITNLSDELMEAIALEIIDEGRGYSYVKDLCELLEDKIGIKASEGNNSVYRAIDGNCYTDYASLARDFDALADKYSSGGGNNGASGGGGSKGSSKGSSIGSVGIGGVANTPAPTPIKEYVFGDITSCEWAVDSITELYKKGIVSGRGEGVFAPNDAVLREEFVKMITQAFGISGTSTLTFEDVKADDWFKPYVDSACSAGIVNGEGASFGAGKPITRQDMAKIIYGALSKAGIKLESADISGLSDFGNIASYASEGVSALYGAGVIKGKTTTTFAPLDNATRAETAVIISRALALIK